MSRVVRECQDSKVVKMMSRECQEGVKSCQKGVKSCQEGGMRVTVSRRCQELSRGCQDSVTKKRGVEGVKEASRA